MCMHVCVKAREQHPASFFGHRPSPSFLFFKTGFLIGLEWARLPDQRAPGTLLSLPPEHWAYKRTFTTTGLEF